MSDKKFKEDIAAEYLMDLLRRSQVGDLIPTAASIARELDMSVAPVKYATDSITEMGYIEATPIPGRPTHSIRRITAIPGPDVAAPKRPQPLSKKRPGGDIRAIALSGEYRAMAHLYDLMETMEKGDKFPTMQEVSDALGLSKPIVQSVYKKLVKRGLAESVVSYGHFLVEKPGPDDPFFDADALREDIEELTKAVEVMKSQLAKIR